VAGQSEKRKTTPTSVPEILQYSSNVGMVQIMQRIKPAVYYNWMERLGLKQTVAIDLPSKYPVS